MYACLDKCLEWHPQALSPDYIPLIAPNPRIGTARQRRVSSSAAANRREELKDVRAAILTSTEQLLAERRLEEISVLDVIEAAGVSRASFYIYFESKNAAVAALANEVTERIYKELWQPFVSGVEPPSQALLTEHWLETLGRWRENRAVMVAAAEAWRADPVAFYQWGAVWRRYIEDIRAYIDRARARGDAPRELDAQALAAALVWFNETALYMAFAHTTASEWKDDEQLAKTIAGVWMRAIYCATPFE